MDAVDSMGAALTGSNGKPSVRPSMRTFAMALNTVSRGLMNPKPSCGSTFSTPAATSTLTSGQATTSDYADQTDSLNHVIRDLNSHEC